MVGRFDDPEEVAADRIAAVVVQRLAAPGAEVHRSLSPSSDPQPTSRIRRTTAPGATSSAAGRDGGELDTGTASRIRQATGGRAMDDQVRARFEPAMGADLSGVRIHTNSALAPEIGATAFTLGNDIHFADSTYDPSSAAGEHLLAHELAHVVQQGGGSVRRKPQNRIIRRRIGFEVETGIPLVHKNTTSGADVWESLFVPDVGDDLTGTDIDAKFSVDHIPGHTATASEPFTEWPIVELVTDPVDDQMSLATFETFAKTKWIDSLVTVKNEAKKSPPAKQLHQDYYVGLPSAQTYDKWDRIAPQVTVGVPLTEVGKLLAAFPVSGTTSAAKASEIGQRAPGIAAGIMRELYGDTFPTDGAGTQAVKGLVTLVVNYLLIGGDPDIAKVIYMKNRPSNIFVKSKLSEIRNNIVGKHPYGQEILDDRVKRRALKASILTATGRARGERLFIADTRTNVPVDKRGAPSTVKVGKWLDDVMAGIEDAAFMEMKNDWSTDIDPDDADEAVIELRKPFVSTGAGLNLEDGSLLAYMKKTYAANQLLKSKNL